MPPYSRIWTTPLLCIMLHLELLLWATVKVSMKSTLPSVQVQIEDVNTLNYGALH